jgi:hypothetical protein
MGLSQFSNFRVLQEQDGQWPAAVHVSYGIASLFVALAKLPQGAAISILPETHAGEPHALAPSATGRKQTDWGLWFFDRGRWNWRTIGARDLDDLAVDLIDLLRQDDLEVAEIRIVPPGALQPRAIL